jgi:phosphate transport system protein
VASRSARIIGSIRIASDLERVGDLGKNIAKRVIAVHTRLIPCKLVAVSIIWGSGADTAEGSA